MTFPSSNNHVMRARCGLCTHAPHTAGSLRNLQAGCPLCAHRRSGISKTEEYCSQSVPTCRVRSLWSRYANTTDIRTSTR